MKKKLLAWIMSALCLAAAIPATGVLADGQKVVTLGADLSEEQKQAILRYFGIAGQSIQTLTITNQDERNHLGSYVPLEQIGTHTYSCALVCPTNSGGIQVKTANLSWVTSNMIATTLSTSGVVNCDVLAAAPFEVSGTGALTGILMAYESAVGAQLDETKKEIATQEMITTTTIANSIGQQQATDIVNGSKMEVIQNNDVTENDIDIIINEVANEKHISLTDEDRALLEQLLEEIANQDYDYDEMKDTLERVEENLNNEIAGADVIESPNDEIPVEETTGNETVSSNETETQETLAEDSILMNTDDSALGDSVNFDATDNAALEETEPPVQTESSDEFDIVSSDEYTETPGDAYIETEPAEVPDSSDVTLNLEILPLSEFIFAPVTSESTAYEVYPAGIHELTVSFERGDIIAGSGTLSLYHAADSSLIETVNMSDPKKVAIEPLDPEELINLGWMEGYKAVISLNDPLAQNTAYFVTLSQDAFSTVDGIGTSEATPDSYSWVIQTSWYGFCLDKPEGGFLAGTTAAGEIMMDGSDAGYACIENADASMISFDQTEFWASGTLNAALLQPGSTTFQVAFYDAAGGTLLNTIEYTAEAE